MKKLIILGAGGHGRVVADVAARTGVYEEIAFLDDGYPGDDFRYAYLGKCQDAEKYVAEYEMVVAVGNNQVRKMLFNQLKQIGASIATIIAMDAIIGSDVEIGEGTVVLSGTVVNTGTRIGRGVILNTASSADHDCVVEDFCHVAVGARLCGAVHIGESSWIGAGVTVKNHTSICADCVVGVGAAVVSDLIESGVYVGVPAKKM